MLVCHTALYRLAVFTVRVASVVATILYALPVADNTQTTIIEMHMLEHAFWHVHVVHKCTTT